MAAGPRRPASRRHQHRRCWTATSLRSWPGRCRSARSTGSVRCSPSMPMPSITAAPRSSRRSPPSRSATTTSATPSRPPRIGSSRCIGASPMATSIRVPGVRDSTPPCDLRMSAWAPLLDTSNVNHGLLLPILLHCRDDQGRPLLGPTRQGPRDQGIPAQRPRRYSSGRRGHAPILDADPLRPRWLIDCLRGSSYRLRKISSDARHSCQEPTLSQTALAARSEAERRARREAKGPAEEPTGAADRQRTGGSEREQ